MKNLKILLIAGHGAGDPGAVALDYREADLTRELVALVKPRLSQYADVTVFDTNKNMYKYLSAGNKFNFKQFDYVIEFHFNAAAKDLVGNDRTTGVEILIHPLEGGYSVEAGIVNNISALGFKLRPGLHSPVKNNITNLLVMNTCKKSQGVSYALLETCFIDDRDDMNLYQAKKNEIADAIVKGIVDGFGLSAPSMTAEQAIDKLVKAGIINSPDYWLNAVKSVEHLDTLFIKFAKTL